MNVRKTQQSKSKQNIYYHALNSTFWIVSIWILFRNFSLTQSTSFKNVEITRSKSMSINKASPNSLNFSLLLNAKQGWRLWLACRKIHPAHSYKRLIIVNTLFSIHDISLEWRNNFFSTEFLNRTFLFNEKEYPF